MPQLATDSAPTSDRRSGASPNAVDLVVGLAVVICLATGLALRFGELSRKSWWADELATWVVLSGCTADDIAGFADGRPHVAAELLRCQRVDPALGYGSSLRALLDDGPQNLPLYFLLARAGVLLLDWEWAPRLVSAVASTLALAAGAALARELFDSRFAAALAAALAAVSPLHLRFALDARTYSLWSSCSVLTGWLLLRAYRRNRRRDWWWYGAAQALTLQTHLLALPVSVGLWIWAWLRSPRRQPAGPTLRCHGLALLAAGAPLVPWAVAAAGQPATVQQTLEWTAQQMPVAELTRRWFGILTTIFLRTGADGGLIGSGEQPGIALARIGIGACVVLLVGACLRQVWRTQRSAASFALALGLPLFVMLALPDLLSGGRRSMIARYLVPAWWAAELLVAGAMASWISGRHTRAVVAQGAALALVVVLGCGLWSCVRVVSQPAWWDTDPEGLRMLTHEAERNAAAPSRYYVERAPAYQIFGFARLLPAATILILGAPPPAGAAGCETLPEFGSSPPSRISACPPR